MKRLTGVKEIRTYQRGIKSGLSDASIGFVPTMGALHDGHVSLIRQSRSENDITIVSIYINPTQFNNPDDFSGYPVSLADDLQLLEAEGVNAVFLPEYDSLYPDDFAFEIDEKVLSQTLCGADRPGHFTGVLTVVMKLLNLVQPDRAYFGEKDYQQLALVRGMAEAFFLEIEIVAGKTVRETDGLAMSSRNLNLSAEDRRLAPRFYELLNSAEDDEHVKQALLAEGFQVDYVSSIDARRFGAVVLKNGRTPVRLIDNVQLR